MARFSILDLVNIAIKRVEYNNNKQGAKMKQVCPQLWHRHLNNKSLIFGNPSVFIGAVSLQECMNHRVCIGEAPLVVVNYLTL